MLILDIEKHFWSCIDWSCVSMKDSSDCWNWSKSKNAGGYGQFYFNKKMQVAHRVSWKLTYGDIPEGKLVCHTCDNPSCVNPSHLFIGTHKDNMVDKWLKGRQPYGKHAGGKLSDKQVKDIRELCVIGMKQNKIAKMFKVNPSTISNIINYSSHTLI